MHAMVSALRLVPDSLAAAVETIGEGLDRPERAQLAAALEFAEPLYAGQLLSTEEPVWPHALGLAASLAAVGADARTRTAGVLFAAPKYLAGTEALAARVGEDVARIAAGVERLYRLRLVTRANAVEQSEVLRKMVLGMVEDVRVVLVRLASRLQTLRWFAKNAGPERELYARETLEIYAPLANRLGVWQLKWEMEDLAFRFLEPALYHSVAQMLEEKRAERETYIRQAMARLSAALAQAGLAAEVTGRPKHIYSIWNKMRVKRLDFSELHDLRALRVIVRTVPECYAALGVVHQLWEPVAREFDDYIARPKPNGYRSLHTAVVGPEGRTVEVQIRTDEMHRQAEQGVAAHWRYKEGVPPAKSERAFEERLAWLRQLLAWRDEVAAGAAAGGGPAARNRPPETVYVFTPQGKVIDLPAGATPVDFAYALHTDIGHRCRGARVDGRLVPLDTPLVSGQRVEILTAKSGGPSRDWLDPARGFVRSARARQKVRQWFNAQAHAELVARGREALEREQRREGVTAVSHERLAERLGLAGAEALYAAIAREEVNLRQLQTALRERVSAPAPAPSEPVRRRAAASADTGVLVVGTGRLLTQLARCCKPLPPDAVRGFVTRGRGVSVHREDCEALRRLAERHPERLLEVEWGAASGGRYPVEVVVVAHDRPGLLRDVGDALARAGISVTAVRTQSRGGLASMRFAFEVEDAAALRRALAAVREVAGVLRVGRA